MLDVPPTGPGMPLEALFVCTANICRSPFAEALARHLVPDGSIRFRSAGTHGWDGHPVEAEMATRLRARGVTADGFVSRPLRMAMVDAADLVLTMEVAHRSFVLVERPEAFRRVFTLRQFAGIVADLPSDLHGRDLVVAAGRALRPATVADDVADPFGRGPEAAEVAAGQLDALLREILPRLQHRSVRRRPV